MPTLAHECRNALGAAVIWLDLLQTSRLDSHQQSLLARARENLEKLADLLAQLTGKAGE